MDTPTVATIIGRANRGHQRKCGFLADHSDIHYAERRRWQEANPYTGPYEPERYGAWLQESYEAAPSRCPECEAHADIMRWRWNKGEADARRDLESLTPNQIIVASLHAHQAWADVPAIEPAVSYISGYSMILDDARRRQGRSR